MVAKPKSKSELLPPFDRIGETGWDRRLRSFLASYDVPQAEPSSVTALAACEERLGLQLLESHRTFLEVIGPQVLDYLTVLPCHEIRTPDECFVAALPSPQRSRLAEYLRVGDAGGSGNVFTLHIPTGAVHLLSHDPLGHRRCLSSFDDLVRIAIIATHVGRYGWPDKDVHRMAEELMDELFGFVL